VPNPPAHTARLFDGGRRERFFVISLAIALVLVRCFVPVRYEGYYFDSDQAVVGLMAKHIAEFKEFPLFYWGQNYMLGVQAWIIAPFFWIARPSVAMMRLPLTIINAAVAVWLVTGLARALTLRPALAFIAALPFIVPPPALSGYLVQVYGGSIEPFVYILFLWTLRNRPLAFGVFLAFGYLHREFTIFAVPALILAKGTRREFWTRETLQRAKWMLIGFAVVWVSFDDLRMHLAGEPLGLQMASLASQLCPTSDKLPSRIRSLVTEALPMEFAGVRQPILYFGMNTPVVAGSTIMAVLFGAALLLMIVRLLVIRAPRVERGGHHPRSGAGDDDRFGVYLAWIGVITACAYPLSCQVTLHGTPLLRYLVFVVLLPVGLCATYFQRERIAALRGVVAAVFVAWSAMNLVDHARVIRQAVAEPPHSLHRELADYLTSRGIRYARAVYWDAYIVDFLARERVLVASLDISRHPDYERQVDAHASSAVIITRQPCEGSATVALWCVGR